MRILLYSIFMLLTSQVVLGQSENSKNIKLEKARIVVQTDLQKHLESLSFKQGSLLPNLQFFNSKMGITLDGGFNSKIQYLDQSGYPVFYGPHNKNAGITTGAVQLQPGGSLGLSLTGKGLTVGIFDQTRPKPDHAEFQGRLTQIDGSSEQISTHATHITGTVLAAGINASAKGMAYEATGWAFNWDSDVSKMAANAYDPTIKPNGILLSNHSYGIVLGWSFNDGSWKWFGNASIDQNKDWKFGFYTAKSQAIDEVLFTKPYYLAVWSAGNDRDDRGDDTHDPDGPEDTIGPEGVAKNNLTVGAVEKVLDYQGPGDVVMSSFSSWGPVDDGRIKPDLVGMGVNVFSTSVNTSGGDAYDSQSGTSMAAPNVTGSLFLLQQLYSQRNSGMFMLSSTLKALAIHTTKEAGPAPGPDYMFGWGLLDVKSGAEVILKEDGNSYVIKDEILEDGGFQEFEFLSDGITPIRVTIAWTDPAGSPPSTSLNPADLMLVNDLDLRIVDEDGTEYFPWTLDPTQLAGARATRDRDNFRDNVEQVFIPNPSPKKYRVRVAHKGSLKYGVQQYSLVMTAGSQDGADETLYWIGSTGGNWEDQNNWSTQISGAPAGKIPGQKTRVVFEGTQGGSLIVNVNAMASVFSLNLFGDQVIELDLKGNPFTINDGLRVSNQITEIRNGTLNFENAGTNPKVLEFGDTLFDQVQLSFNSGNWRVISGSQLSSVRINNATSVSFDYNEVKVKSLELKAGGTLLGTFRNLTFSENVTFESNSSLKEGVSLIFQGETGTFNNGSTTPILLLIIKSGDLTLLSEKVQNMEISDGKAHLGISALSLNSLGIGSSATLDLGSNGELQVLDSIYSFGATLNESLIQASFKGKIIHDIHRKICFDHISVSNVDLQGQAIINLGTSAQVDNSNGWLTQNCEEILFANFRTSFTCVGAAVDFENLSDGSITSYSWDFAGLGSSTLANPFFVFNTTGTFTVKLVVSNDQNSSTYEQIVVIGDNELIKPVIVANGTNLTSQQPGTAFQWYLNGEPIEGATSRSCAASADGSYQVTIVGDVCNRISDPVVISAIPNQEADLNRFGIFVGPVPSEDLVTIIVSNDYRGPIAFQLIDMAGRVYISEEFQKIGPEMQVELNLPGNKGIYILKMHTDNLTLHKKLMRQ